MEKLYDFWNGIVGEDADPKKQRKVYIALGIFVVVLVLFAL
jgi:hypothetical protein